MELIGKIWQAKKEFYTFWLSLFGVIALGCNIWLAKKQARDNRFANGVELLGKKSESTRIGGIHILCLLAKEHPTEYRKSVFETLCGHVRNKTTEGVRKDKPSSEIRALLNLLFRKDLDLTTKMKPIEDEFSKYKGLFNGLNGFNGAYLDGCYLRKAHLSEAHLQGAKFTETDLRGANFKRANLQEAKFFGADLKGTQFEGAHLEGADFKRAHWKDAHWEGAIYNKKTIFPEDFDQKDKMIEINQ